MMTKSETFKVYFNLDPKGVLCKKVQDNGKEFKVLIVPKALQKYVLYESHNSLGHNFTTQLYQFLKSQYYVKASKRQCKSLYDTVGSVK